MAAATRRVAGKKMAIKVSRRVMGAYEVVEENALFDAACEIAADTGCSGFDSYFISLAMLKKAVLLTDDAGMRYHAEKAGVECILIRDAGLEGIDNLFKRE